MPIALTTDRPVAVWALVATSPETPALATPVAFPVV
jgi:hypothetical protein